mgnify:CR=1 FL=1
MALHIYTFINPCSAKDLHRAKSIIEDGGVICYPTDVNWAFAADPRKAGAIDRILRLKPGHPKELPFSMVCSSIAMAAQYAQIEAFSYRLLKKILPGPFTVILPRNHAYPRALRDKRKAVGIRIPNSPLILELVELLGQPLATSSVPGFNPKDHSLIEYGYQVEEFFGFGVDLILDLGHPLPYQETTILDMTEGYVKMVRAGAGDSSLLQLS